MNKDTLRVSHTTISSGLTAANDKLYAYYPIFNEDCEGMEILYIATVLHSKYKLNYFRTRNLFPPSLIDCIKTKLENLFKLYEIYYARLKLVNDEVVELNSESNHGADRSIAGEENFSYLSDEDVSEVEYDELTAYLVEPIKNSNVVDYPVLYQFARDIMAIPAMSAPAESFFSILGDIVTKKRNKLYPVMTKMVAVVKDKVRRISPGDDESGVDSDNEMIEDEAKLSGQLQREMNDSRDENSEEGESGSTRIS